MDNGENVHSHIYTHSYMPAQKLVYIFMFVDIFIICGGGLSLLQTEVKSSLPNL